MSARRAWMSIALVAWHVCHLPGQTTPTAGSQFRGTVDLILGGGLEPGEDYLFGTVTGLFLDSHGVLYVGDASTGSIRTYSDQGRFLRTIGQRGEGPGDFRAPCCMTVDSTGRFWIRDWRNNRYTAIELAPAVPRHSAVIRMPFPSGVPLSPPAWDAKGRLIHVARAQSGENRGRLMRMFLSLDGEVTGQSLVPEILSSPRSQVIKKKSPSGGTAEIEILEPFSGYGLNAFSRNGDFLVGHTDAYDVTWYSSAGTKVRTLRRNVTGVPASEEERKEAENKLASRAIELRVSRSALRMKVPRYKPPVGLLGFDLEGRAWVQLAVPQGQPNMADVYASGGRLLGTYTWPANVTLYQFAVRGAVGIGVARDEYDTQTVVRVKFTPSGPTRPASKQ
jgi:hypothetical protein